jgi:hypothetical protein
LYSSVRTLTSRNNLHNCTKKLFVIQKIFNSHLTGQNRSQVLKITTTNIVIGVSNTYFKRIWQKFSHGNSKIIHNLFVIGVWKKLNKLRKFKILLSVSFSFLKPNFFNDTCVYWTYSVEIVMFTWHCTSILPLVMGIIFKPIHIHKSQIRTECVRAVMSNIVH